MQKLPFSALGLSEAVLKAVEKLGFEETSPIQSAAIPVLMSGKDVVGQSATGSGKTAAFGIPAIERVKDTDRKPQILVLVPTRELATQVAEEFSRLCAFRPKVHAVPIYGGASYDRQFSELRKGPQIVIGTPGRIIDHLQRNTLDLSEIKMAVLDECDRMLDMGFREDMERILSAAPKERQTVFFSATLPPAIKRLIETFGNQPEHIKIEGVAMTVPTVEQIYFDVPPREKLDALTRLLDIHDARLSIVFANTQRTVDEIADALLARGYAADRLHGGISQALRTRTMGKFKRSEFDILVATDVAGRGLDVDDLDLVINYDLPYDPEDYLHRIGRTGRAGRKGVAMTLVSGREAYRLQYVERFTKTRIRRGRVPTWDQVEEKRLSEVLDKVRATLTDGSFSTQGIYIDRLLDEGHAATDLAAALLQQLIAAEGIETAKKDGATPAGAGTPSAPAARAVPAAAPAPAAKKPVKEKAAPVPAVPAPASVPPPVEAPAPVAPPVEAKAPPAKKVPEPIKQIAPPAPEVEEEAEAEPEVPEVHAEAIPDDEDDIAEATDESGDMDNEEEDAALESEAAEADSEDADEEDEEEEEKPAPRPAKAPKAAPAPAPAVAAEKPSRKTVKRAVQPSDLGNDDEVDEAEAAEPEYKKGPRVKSTTSTAELPSPAPGYRWITLSAGNDDGLAPRDVVDAITEGGEFEGKSVGLIKIHDKESHVQVKTDVAAAVIEALEGALIGEKELHVHFTKTGGPGAGKKPADDRKERPAFRRDDDRAPRPPFRRDDGPPRKDYGGFRKPDRPYGDKPGSFPRKPGGFRKDYADRGERSGPPRPEGRSFDKKPGGFYKKPGGYAGKPGGYGAAKPAGFRTFGENRQGETRSWTKDDDRPAGDRPRPPRDRDEAPRKKFGGPKFGGPKKGPGRW